MAISLQFYRWLFAIAGVLTLASDILAAKDEEDSEASPLFEEHMEKILGIFPEMSEDAMSSIMRNEKMNTMIENFSEMSSEEKMNSMIETISDITADKNIKEMMEKIADMAPEKNIKRILDMNMEKIVGTVSEVASEENMQSIKETVKDMTDDEIVKLFNDEKFKNIFDAIMNSTTPEETVIEVTKLMKQMFEDKHAVTIMKYVEKHFTDKGISSGIDIMMKYIAEQNQAGDIFSNLYNLVGGSKPFVKGLDSSWNSALDSGLNYTMGGVLDFLTKMTEEMTKTEDRKSRKRKTEESPSKKAAKTYYEVVPSNSNSEKKDEKKF